MFEWDDLRVFLAVHRTGSHAGAGRLLRVAPTTIGRRIAALEAAIGSRLFTRRADGLKGTAAAVALRARAERVEAELLEAERELAGADARPTGTVKITCGDGFATCVLAPALPAFLATHPGLDIEIWADVRSLDLTRGEADVAIRNYRPREGSLVARKLGLERTVLHAAPSYLSAHGVPRTARDLAGHDLILYERSFDRQLGQAWLRRVAPAARVAVRANTTAMMHAACAGGAGIALLSSAFVRDDRRFVPVLPTVRPPPLELWAVTHGELRAAARISATLRWLEQLVIAGGGFD